LNIAKIAKIAKIENARGISPRRSCGIFAGSPRCPRILAILAIFSP